MAMPSGASSDTFDDIGGVLPSLAAATAYNSEGAMASDALSLARWFRGFCAGEIVSPVSLSDMADFGKRPKYGLGLIDRRGEYGRSSGALGVMAAIAIWTSKGRIAPIIAGMPVPRSRLGPAIPEVLPSRGGS